VRAASSRCARRAFGNSLQSRLLAGVPAADLETCERVLETLERENRRAVAGGRRTIEEEEAMNQIVVNEPNRWRLETPRRNWPRSARPDAAKKYFMVSADGHANEPATLWVERIDAQYKDRLPRVITDKDGVQWRVSEGHRPDRLRLSTLEGEDMARNKAGADPLGRLADHDLDGIDVELIFPNKGLAMWATPDPQFAMAQCRVWNDWAWEQFGKPPGPHDPAGALATADLEGSIAEVKRLARLGFKCLTLPCKPVWGAHDSSHVNYNLPHFDPLWAAITDAGLPITFHVSTGRDPRAARGNGGAVVNYVSHSLSPTIEPVAEPLRLGRARALPDLALRHHRGRHRLGAVAARGDGRGLQEASLLGAAQAQAPAERVLPHARLLLLPGGQGRARSLREPQARPATSCGPTTTRTTKGTWPHSAEAIERTMGGVSDATRAKILGLNCARFLGLEVPAKYRQ
jgi:predicted TIM-barrel fold metal-dependent hydrolase